MMQSEHVNELIGALVKAQGVMENAALNKENSHFKTRYADLSSVIDAARKPLSDNGLAVTQQTVISEGGLRLRTTLWHTSGQYLASEFPLPSAARPQEYGSALTYARRYTYTALICNAADEDDDANAAEGQGQQVRTPAKPKPVKIAEPPAATPAAPHPIMFDDPLNPDWIQWGSRFTAFIKAARTLDEIDAWEAANGTTLAAMREAAEKVAARVNANLRERRQELGVSAAA